MSEKLHFQVLNLENPDLHKYERDGLHLTKKGVAWYIQQIKVVMNPLMNLGVCDRYNHLNSSQSDYQQNNRQIKLKFHTRKSVHMRTILMFHITNRSRQQTPGIQIHKDIS